MMSVSTGLRILVADLVKRPGSSRHVELDEPVAGLAIGGSAVGDDDPVHVALDLERIVEGIVARGTIAAAWAGDCARCLRPVGGPLIVGVDELFEPDPVAGETYVLEQDVIDLEPLLRDAIVPELPTAPLCRPDCAGLCPQCGADRNETACDCRPDDLDPRWAALRSLDPTSETHDR